MPTVKILANLSKKVTIFTNKGVVEEGPSKDKHCTKYKMFTNHLYYAKPQLEFYNLIILNTVTNKTVVTDFVFSKNIWLQNKEKLIDGHSLELKIHGK